ncbi:hypothetical protein COO60DRAFT_1018739 [Scenedesmus sp. NREL 46B-D3]|nr:hypothetical protein COO60DRAFT_1018739 [Scenedesmus sp. NREL 46B-D3]
MVLFSAGHFSVYSLTALGMHGHLVLMWQHVFGDVWVVILMPRRHYINKPYKAFMPGAAAHQGGGWVQLLQGSQEALCLLSHSVSPWSASSWLLPSSAAACQPIYPPAHPSSWLLLGIVVLVLGCGFWSGK